MKILIPLDGAKFAKAILKPAADLVPGLHREWSLGALPVQVGLIGLGALVIFAVRWVAH